MGKKQTHEFFAAAVWLALMSGLIRKPVATDLGECLSKPINGLLRIFYLTAFVCMRERIDIDVFSDKRLDFNRQNVRLWRAIRILKRENLSEAS